MDLLSLADRVERLTEHGCYQTDCDIWDAIYPGERQARFDALTAKGQPYHRRLGPADMDGYVKPLRAFTTSLDAAMTLVPDGWEWTVNTFADPIKASAYCINAANEMVRCRQQYQATPALALCAAALRSRAQEGV